MRWSLFCRVVDNYGDAGFCLRLARELRARGETVDLYIDDAAPLAWMQAGERAPPPALPWPGAAERPLLGEVVIEAFGCELPDGVQAAMRAQARPPLWINLEYLSAEAYVERSHGLPSPVMSGPAAGLVKRFCYPGFSRQTAGLLQEQALAAVQAVHSRDEFLADLGLKPAQDEALISLFCYPGAPLAALFEALDGLPALLLVCGQPKLPPAPASLRLQPLPLLSQAAYDGLLWSCDLNLVRGEDSFVRAQLAGRPMLWQLYPQQDGAHGPKLEAYLQRRGLAPAQRQLWRAWNGLEGSPLRREALLACLAAGQEALAWREQLRQGAELVDSLLAWAKEPRG